VVVQEHGCAALTNLAAKNINNKTVITSEGGVSVVVSAMEAHVGHVALQEMGCNVLKNLGTSAYKQSRIGALMIYAIGDVKAWLPDTLFFFFFLFSVQQFGREWVYLTYAFVFFMGAPEWWIEKLECVCMCACCSIYEVLMQWRFQHDNTAAVADGAGS